jgi:hypothetical protein
VGVEPIGRHGFPDSLTLKAAAEVHVNSNHDPTLQKQITEELKQELADIFKPHNALLDELLGVKTGY